MSVRLILAAVAALALASPALAQTAQGAQSTAPAVDPAEAAFQARAAAFGARVETMAGEMRAAALSAEGDPARARAALDGIAARYQPEADAFAAELETFIASRATGATEEQRAQMAQVGPMLLAQIKGVPAQARDQMLAAIVAGATAPEGAQ